MFSEADLKEMSDLLANSSKCFQRLDLNNDGVVTMDEFLDACSADPATLQSLAHLSTTL